MSELTLEQLNQLEETYRNNDKARVVRNALKENSVAKISRVFESDIKNTNVFSIDLHHLPVTNQKASGRCWIFSELNILREEVAKKINVDAFELSENYLAFYDKIEKVNWFMNCTLEELDSSMNSRNLVWLLDNAIGDGGQWNMIVSLIKKYGICPKSAMPETFQSSNTSAMNEIIHKRLVKFVKDSRNAHKEGHDDAIEDIKANCLKDCYSVIASCFGLPPKTFDFEYRDKDKKFFAEYDVTPMEFYKKYIGSDIDEYVALINTPRYDLEFDQTYTVKYLGNVVNGEVMKYVNIPLDRFKQAIIKQLKAKECVWFVCDCLRDGDRLKGLWDDQQFDYANTFDIDLTLSKQDMLDYRFGSLAHAMVIDGVNLVNDKPSRWKIENSWSNKNGYDGFYIMSDSWFDQYVYEAVVKKEYLDELTLEAEKKEPKVLECWDILG